MPDENGYCRVCGGSDGEAAEYIVKTEPFQLLPPERERELDRQLYADHLAQQHAERRERIATAALIGVLADGGLNQGDSVVYALECADKLIAALDAKDTP